MVVTILLLIFTVIGLPMISFYLGTPLTPLQSSILYDHMVWIVGGVIAYCFIVGELSRNNSQVDKLWSIVPVYYAWHMTAVAGFPDRMTLMAVLVSIWGVRLTFNFARRGAYTWKFWAGEEDYRWEILRKRPGFSNPWIWAAFNLFFISGYQNTLIFLFTIPILTATQNSPLMVWDGILVLIFILFVVVEFVADQQQWNFQQEKHRRIRLGLAMEEYAHGFVRTGLWSRVRHPNYAMEQAIWLVFYGFSIIATGEWINWSMAGCVLLVILFKGSSDFSEAISAEKYPEYKAYQSNVPRFIPFTKFLKR